MYNWPLAYNDRIVGYAMDFPFLYGLNGDRKVHEAQERWNFQQKEQEIRREIRGDFTSRENWDEFFKLRSDDPFEWYRDWRNLAKPLAKHCSLNYTISKNGRPRPLF